MTTTYVAARPAEGAMNLAMLGYALLFASIFFAGLPALIAVVIAYSHRREAARPLRRHFNSQIRIFWVALALTSGPPPARWRALSPAWPRSSTWPRWAASTASAGCASTSRT